MKEYPVKGEKITYLSDSEINQIGIKAGLPLWRAKLIGGWGEYPGTRIWIRESRRGDVKLLNHERGHLRGYHHTWLPTLMFPSWVGRIFNRYVL